MFITYPSGYFIVHHRVVARADPKDINLIVNVVVFLKGNAYLINWANYEKFTEIPSLLDGLTAKLRERYSFGILLLISHILKSCSLDHVRGMNNDYQKMYGITEGSGGT